MNFAQDYKKDCDRVSTKILSNLLYCLFVSNCFIEYKFHKFYMQATYFNWTVFESFSGSFIKKSCCCGSP